MCWYNYREDTELRTAEEPIEVTKIILYDKDYKKYKSYYEGFEYEMKKLYTIDEESSFVRMMPPFYTNDGGVQNSLKDFRFIVEKGGFHSYKGYKIRKRHNEMFTVSYLETKDKNGNTHAYYCPHPYILSVVRCTIPAGSHYMININGEVISDQIIIDRVVKRCNGRSLRTNFKNNF